MNARSLVAGLRRSTRGVAATELALALPILLALGCYGIEVSNLALTELRVSQYTLYLADNASRIGLTSTTAATQLREGDINDIFTGLRLQSAPLKLTTFGRVTLSSLERQSDGTQLLHWQRCVGLKANVGTGANKVYYDSSYGTAGASGTTVASMGDSWAPVTAPANYAVMFVEINYDYRPLFGTTFVAAQKLHYVASYIVRDTRDYTQIYNPSPAQTASSCTTYTT